MSLSELYAEKRRTTLARLILSLPEGASSVLLTLDPETDLSRLKRPCDYCGTVFNPPLWKSRFCTSSCSTRWWMNFPEHRAKIFTPERAEKCGQARKKHLASGSPSALAEIERIRRLNPTQMPGVPEKISQTLKRMGHRPPIIGGNGRPTPEPQRLLHETLGEGWSLEHVVRTGQPPTKGGLPTHFKLDIANPALSIWIECDGYSHSSHWAKGADKRKTDFLVERGWTALRFSNQEILDWISSEKPTDSSISTIFRRLGIPASA